MKRLLWTGGWDSTYRLLYSIIVENNLVQPYYILDFNRPSYKKEIDTMNIIKNKIYEKFPLTKGKINNTIFIKINEIEENQTITDKYMKLKEESFIGSQYDWLARYAESEDLTNLELSIHLDDKAAFFVKRYGIKNENSKVYYLDKNMYGTQYDIFKYFDFPILDLTKLDMQRNAEKYDFLDIMELTWFCYNPMPNGQPCGYCNPCKYTREEGMGRRVPSKTKGFSNRVRNKIKRILNKHN